MTKEEDSAIEMFVGGLVLDPNTQAPVVILKDESGDICLPIWIGIAEATSIASAIKQINMQRPLTHDLMQDVFDQVGVRVERIVVTELTDQTYFAELVLSFGDKAIIIDSRPSDAIALALRSAAPIYVAKAVLDQAKVSFTPGTSGEQQGQEGEEGDKQAEGEEATGPEFSNLDKDQWEEILKSLDPDDFKYKM